MFNEKYTLDIISHHPQFRNRPLKKYGIDGIETIGAWGDEPFEIKFKNNTYSKIQVKLSVDGTDILTGDLASTEPSGQMWMVNPYGTLNIKAWPESQNGGAALVFTSANNSVALNTHGNLSNRGIIAAAVFVEGHVEPIRIDNSNWYGSPGYFGHNGSICRDARRCKMSLDSDNTTYSKGIKSFESNISNSTSLNGQSFDYCSESDSISEANAAPELKSLASVGAGSYVNQHISYVKGLIQPIFTETVRVKYVWWDELKAKLENSPYAMEQPSGFPGDPPRKMINLGGTPRVDTHEHRRGTFKRAPQDVWSRF